MAPIKAAVWLPSSCLWSSPPPTPRAPGPTVSTPAVAGNQVVLTRFSPQPSPTLAWARGLPASASSSEKRSHNGTHSQGCCGD